MKFEYTEVWGFKHALRGMRNPLESWEKSDTVFSPELKIGENDMELALKLIHGGTEHRKFLRQIFVSVDITAPLYWWKEFDTYKIGTTANSTSTMHKISSKPISIECFEVGDYNPELCANSDYDIETVTDAEFVGFNTGVIIDYLESLRKSYLKTKDKRYWKELIRWLPESWLQTRTCTMDYENLISMRKQRKGHKLVEWHKFCDWTEELPYLKCFACEEAR